MTFAEFKENEDKIAKAVENALWQAVKQCPEGFYEWLFVDIKGISGKRN